MKTIEGNNWTVEVDTFGSPSGDMLGVVLGFVRRGKRSRRVAHAYVLTTGIDEVTISGLTKGATLADLDAMVECLAAFRKVCNGCTKD